MELSIVVTTYDRPELLRRCLDSLATQVDELPACELIVVDNAGQTTCRELVTQTGHRYVVEEKTGHCHARNRGLQEARAPWVLFLDDDVILPTGLLSQFIEYLPLPGNAVAFGGRFYHWFLQPPPAWLQQWKGEGVRPGANASFGPLADHEYLIGCFFAVEVAAAQRVGGFDPQFGMQGKEVGWADETDMQLRLRQSGGVVYYAPELVIKHLLQPWKCSLRGQLRFAYSHGKLNCLPGRPQEGGWLSFVLALIRITLITVPVTLGRWLFRHREWYWQTVFLRIATKYAYAFGRFDGRRTVRTDAGTTAE